MQSIDTLVVIQKVGVFDQGYETSLPMVELEQAVIRLLYKLFLVVASEPPRNLGQTHFCFADLLRQ